MRRFTRRFHTRLIVLLDEALRRSRFTRTEAGVLYELATGEVRTASEIGRRLALDPGYDPAARGRGIGHAIVRTCIDSPWRPATGA